jgi:Ca2+-binding EF-hand superfamily protein
MDANEIEELLYEADPQQSGQVYYQAFVDNMFLYD